MSTAMWTIAISVSSFLTLHKRKALVGILVLATIIDGMLPAPLQSHGGPNHRFVILGEFQGEAVLDRETQLIWERAPSTAETRWGNAGVLCALKRVGGQPGWRLPTFFELMTLVDPARHDATNPSLSPVGNPFTGIGGQGYWSSNTHATEATKAYAVDFAVGDVAVDRKHTTHRLWCVRGGLISFPDRDEDHVQGGPHWS